MRDFLDIRSDEFVAKKRESMDNNDFLNRAYLRDTHFDVVLDPYDGFNPNPGTIVIDIWDKPLRALCQPH